jgi:hypothetical protein
MTDPTDLQCSACGTPYPLNSPRVVRVLLGCRSNTADLCWVCVRLKSSVEQENQGLNQEAAV